MEINPFVALYAGLSNEKLVAVVANAADYQPLAVEAAKSELARRNVLGEEIESLNHTVLIQKQPNLYALRINAFFEKYFLFPGESRAIAYIINAISAVLFLLYFLNNKSYFEAMVYYIDTQQISPYIIYSACLLVATFVLIFIFWRRIIVGWMYVCGWAVYGLVYTSLHFYYAIIEHTNMDTETGAIFFPDRAGEYFIFWWLFYGFALYLVSKNYIRNRYGINTVVLVLSIVIGFALAVPYAITI